MAVILTVIAPDLAPLFVIGALGTALIMAFSKHS